MNGSQESTAGVQPLQVQDIMIRAGKRLELYKKLQQDTARGCPAVVLCHEENRVSDSRPVALQATDSYWHDFLAACRREETFSLAPCICQADGVINILFSSGTTGAPKAIPWMHTTALRYGAGRLVMSTTEVDRRMPV
jgi:acetyl-CoA synthetase